MSRVSRHKTREYLFQVLFAKSVSKESFNRESFDETFYEDEYLACIDAPYFEELYWGILSKERELISLVEKFAPKFDIAIMPIANILPVFIAGYEMLFLKWTIPDRVSLNEAIELTKTYSDDSARLLVNGILNSVMQSKSELLESFNHLSAPKFTVFI